MTEARARLNALPNKFPRVFSQPLTWGFEHGDGWAHLIATLCERLDTILQDDPNATVNVLQVKEKFGGLRFYYRLVSADGQMAAQVREAVDLAEAASTNICESCGRPGELQSAGGWYSTKCSLCRSDPD